MTDLPGSGDRSTPELSVIIPIYASGPEAVDLLREALRHLKGSRFRNFEVLVADDASPAGVAIETLVRQEGAQLLRLDPRRGPAAARNAAARKATGNIITFLDADTSVHTDTLDRFVGKFRENPDLDAAMGSYDQQPTALGVVSRFRNLLHSFVHHRANRRAWTFWAGCSAIRKDRFLALGGFDESFPRPSIEDVEFGIRLCEAGGWVELDPQIQVTHHKSWTLGSMLRTDLLARAIPWAAILHKQPVPLDLNFRAVDRISVALAAITLLSAVMALIYGGAWLLAPLVSLAAIGLLNWPLFCFLARATSWTESLLCFPLLVLYLGTCVAGLIAGTALAEYRQRRWLRPAAAMIGLRRSWSGPWRRF